MQDKASSIVDYIKNLKPISESQQIWNSIDASELTKRRLSLVAKASCEIEVTLEKKT